MGAYLSSPITEKEIYSGSNKFLEYGGASMQGWRRSMEDAHIAVLELGNDAGMAMFGVFDGHGGSEVARFCQKYMAEEITKTETYSKGNVCDSLIEVFHKIDLMLRDDAYQQELSTWRNNPSLENETSSPQAVETPPEPEKAQRKVTNATADALQLIKRVLALRKKEPEPAASQSASSGGNIQPAEEALTSDVAVESVEGVAAENVAEQASASLRPDAQGESQIQAGCTALVAIFKDDKLFVANAGDSRAVLCRGSNAIPLSQDHKPASESEKSRITAAGGWVSTVNGVNRVNGNLNLSRAIGDLKYKTNKSLPPADQIISAEPDVTITTLTEDDWFIVLACDGVWDVYSNQDVVNFVGERLGQGIPASEVASGLLDACLAIHPLETRGIGCDNMTATIVVMRNDIRERMQSSADKPCEMD